MGQIPMETTIIFTQNLTAMDFAKDGTELEVKGTLRLKKWTDSEGVSRVKRLFEAGLVRPVNPQLSIELDNLF